MAIQDYFRQLFGGQEEPIRPPSHVPGPYDTETPAMDAFYNGAMNPPVRQPSSKLRMLGTGLLSALQGSTGPESRVPLYNEKGRTVGSREAGFFESLGNKPFNVAQAKSILDIPHDRATEDYKLGMEGLGKAATVESQMQRNRGLPEQRLANAAAIPERLNQGQQKIDISRMTAEEKIRVSRLNTLTDQQKIEMLQDGRISIAELQAAEAMKRLERGGEIRSGHIEQQGDIRSGQIAQQGDIRQAQINQQGEISENLAHIRGDEARQTRTTVPGGSGTTSQLPTQQIKAQQLKANELINAHPEWKDYISINPNTGMVEVAPVSTGGFFSRGPDEKTRKQILDNLGITQNTTPAAEESKTPPPPAKTPVKTTGTTEKVKVMKDGKQYMLTASQVEEAKKQGYTVVK